MPTTAGTLTTWRDERRRLLDRHAAAYAEVALANIAREFPNDAHLHQPGPEPLPRPRDRHPAFYGSFDWHSCVEMHWTLVRLLRLVPGLIPHDRVRAALNEHLDTEPLAAEAAYFTDPRNGPHPAPYGWGWPLMLAREAAATPGPDAHRWATGLRPLTRICADRYLRWLPRATYPVRHGIHTNSAFGLSLALPHAEHDTTLRHAIAATAHRWFSGDTDYPGGWEPAALFTPAVASDPTDGHIAHLHGLNLSRAWCWQRIAETLPDGDPRIPTLIDAARTHADAALPHVVGDHYMVEHWLACYAVLLLT